MPNTGPVLAITLSMITFIGRTFLQRLPNYEVHLN